MTRTWRRSLSLRARIMVIIVGGAVLPLALIGGWLAAAAARSGRDLLRRELETSLGRVTERLQDRWTHRTAELGLLTNNEPVRDLLASREQRPGQDATLYFNELARALRPFIREFTYRDNEGRQRWSSTEVSLPAPDGPLGSRFAISSGFDNDDALLVRRAVVDDAGKPLGTVEARVLLSGILPTDSLPVILAIAALRITNREDGAVIGGSMAVADSSRLVSTRAALAEPPIDLELAASDARYVEPFADAARIGLALLIGVATITLFLTTFLTRRLTKSLEQLVDAAGAVAAGDMARTVSGNGSAELGRLADAFNSMTESLRRTLRELARREALAAVGQFAAAMSHEVRNSLTAVRLDLQRLSEKLTEPESRTLARRLLTNTRRLDSIVTGSLRIARSDPAAMRSLLLEGVVRAAIDAAESAFVESDARVELQPVAQAGLRVRGDASALEQMLVNLLMNAAQAMSAGGVARISVEASGESAVVRIADSGRGIQPDVLERMGERFLSSRSAGTGLGFSIAREIAVAHGGEIRILSTGPDGTTVEVSLPVESARTKSDESVLAQAAS